MNAVIETADYTFMVESVNQGDDSVLPILTDWLEEHGIEEHAGLRWIIKEAKKVCDQRERGHRGEHQRPKTFTWYNSESAEVCYQHNPEEYGDRAYLMHYCIPKRLFRRLKPDKKQYYTFARDYDTRWEAYLDLARAVIQTERESK